MTSSTAHSKSDLRAAMTAQRDNLDMDYKRKYDAWICEQLMQLVIQHDFQTIHTYLPIRSEIDVMPFIKEMLDIKLNVFTSRTLDDGQLQHLHLNTLDELVPGKYGVPYPANTKEYQGTFDLVIVPGLAFDTSNHRLGYGGGYYDRFLAEHPLSFKLGIAFPFQVIDALPLERYDIPVDQLVFAGPD